MLARVIITPKRGVLDPQGKAISTSLHALGFAEVGDVRMGRYLEVQVSDDADPGGVEARVRSMCERLLANGVIEDFRFEIDASGGHEPPEGGGK